MLLEPTQIQALLKAPANGAALAAAVQHEQRIRLHSDPWVSSTPAPSLALDTLLALPKAVLSEEKFKRLLEFLPAPLPSTKLVDQVFDGLARLFEAQDGAITLELATPELETDFELYRARRDEEGFWTGPAYRAFKRAPHTILVVDMAATQTTPRPEPYSYLVSTDRVVDAAIRPDSTCEYLIFALPSAKTEQGATVLRRAVYDDAAYRIYEKMEAAEQWTLALENAHTLGRCPARMLWSEALYGPADLARRSPLTAHLADLDRYVLWDALIEYGKMYGVIPPIWSIEEQCTYELPDGQKCQNGVVNVLVGYQKLHADSNVETPRYQAKECPACSKNKYIGPGTHLVVPAPTKETGDTRKPMGFVDTPVEAMKYAQETQEERKRTILVGCLGADGEAATDQPRNEKDVRAGFESRQDVLVRVKKSFEQAQQWELTTIGQLRYGPAFLRCVVSRGEEFYLKTPEQLAKEENEARTAGRAVFELSQMREQRFFTQYRNNPPLLDRQRILSDLEPWSEYSVEQLYEKITAAQGQAGNYLLTIYPPDRLALKADFARYLARFESEQADVRQFAALQPYHVKIQLITQQLLSYVNVQAPAA